MPYLIHTNCHREKDYGRDTQVLAIGWVGLKGGQLYFRPGRGSGGFAVYDSEAKAKKWTGCPEAAEVTMQLCFHDR